MPNFAVLPDGRVITCQQAVKYRDGRLFDELRVLDRDYANGKQQRIQHALNELNRHRGDLNNAWKRAETADKKKIAVNAIALVLSLAANATGRWASTKIPGGSGYDLDRRVVEHMIDRGGTLTGNVISGYFAKNVDMISIGLLPVCAIATAVESPVISIAVTAVGLAEGLLGIRYSIADLYLDERDYTSQMAIFDQAIERLLEKSLDNQVQRINEIKNEIDAQCG